LRPRLHHAPPRRNLRLTTLRRRILLPGVADQSVEISWSHMVSLRYTLIKLLEHTARDIAGTFRPAQNDDIPMRVRLDAETIFHECQMSVELAEKAGEKPIILERDNHSLVGD
jgi:hypothetical protein